MSATPGFAAIDFGTSNSAIALPRGDDAVELVELEAGFRTMPTAVFYRADEPASLYGRAAIAAYVDGIDGRLMRSMKSVLGSSLLEQSTDVGGGRSMRYLDVIAGFLRHLKRMAEQRVGHPLRRVVLGRPVYFVDDDPQRDAKAQAALEAAARGVGFDEVLFQYEPIAAALDHERNAQSEQRVLVADIGGGTSDFALVRVGPRQRGRLDRKQDILASHGVHLAGTDFDRRIELLAIMPWLGYRAWRPARRGEPEREVPSGIYFDLSTWHLINTVYTPQRVAEVRGMRSWYADADHHRRLLAVLGQRLGHALAGAAEQAKIELAEQGRALVDLQAIEAGLDAELAEERAAEAIESDLARIVATAGETARRAGVAPADVDCVYFTGGSTGLRTLVERIAAVFPAAERIRGDRFASVAQGLGVHARAVFGA